MFKIRLRKERATWYWYTENPQGGGFGSNYCGPKSIALARALHGIPLGTPYTLTVNGKASGEFVKE